VIYRDPRCVFVTDKPGEADVIVVWLGEQGIPAQVMNRATLGGLLGLTPWSTTGVSSSGLEVWVKDPEQASRAVELLGDHVLSRIMESADNSDRDPVEVVCEDCGQTTVFPGNQYGTVQNCPQCGGYLDVVNPGDEDGGFDEAEIGEAEEEQA
jgi:hypothetical protein